MDLKQTPHINIKNEVLNCEVKDSEGLNDFQKLPDTLNIAIPKVGIGRYRIPMNFLHRDGSLMNHDVTASMGVNLAAGKTGINMSRLCQILQNESTHNKVDAQFFSRILSRYNIEMKDNESDKDFDNIFLKLKFSYPLKQKSLKSDNWGWQYYACELEAINSKFYMTVNYEYSSTCPCSLSMAKQYELDYMSGKTNEGDGIATAHSQRSNIHCRIEVKPGSEINIEEIIDILRRAIPTETQSLVKRLDEQAFAILNGSNPMFVEHVSKKVYQVLNNEEDILDWICSIEHFESLHSHNACAVIYKGIENGMSISSIF
jgi:GTP cyclohydrolase I